MKTYIGLVGLFIFGTHAWGSQITVQMLNMPLGSAAEPEFFVFQVDHNEIWKLLCNQFVPNVTSLEYTARVATLDDLTGTALVRAGDPDALKHYQWMAILDLLAYANPSLAANVSWVNRHIAGDPRNLTPAAANLLAFVQAADPNQYDLSGFRIFYGITRSGGFLDTQEQTGFASPVPEPATLVLTISALAGFAGIAAVCRRRTLWRPV